MKKVIFLIGTLSFILTENSFAVPIEVENQSFKILDVRNNQNPAPTEGYILNKRDGYLYSDNWHAFSSRMKDLHPTFDEQGGLYLNFGREDFFEVPLSGSSTIEVEDVGPFEDWGYSFVLHAMRGDEDLRLASPDKFGLDFMEIPNPIPTGHIVKKLIIKDKVVNHVPYPFIEVVMDFPSLKDLATKSVKEAVKQNPNAFEGEERNVLN
jgi:hypothetical protein